MSTLSILGKNPFSWFIQSLRRFGLWQTLTIMWSVMVDMSFDYRHGTDTFRRIPREAIQTDSENIVHCVNYGASKAVPFLRLMRLLDFPKDGVFVDLGSGKGRAVMLASKYGFRKVIGVEFSAELCAKARENIRKFLRKSPSRSQIEIVHSDATLYQLNDDETVFFLLDPFVAPVMVKVLENIRESLKRRPRTIWLVYSVPREQQLVAESGIFVQNRLHVVVGAEFRVYSNDPSARV